MIRKRISEELVGRHPHFIDTAVRGRCLSINDALCVNRTHVQKAQTVPTATQHQWDLLAPVWHHFEQGGSNPLHVRRFAATFRCPALVVGSGLGLLTRAMKDLGLQQVLGVDWSAAMARLARQQRGVETVVTDGCRLPFADQTFRSAVCSTGVLNPNDGSSASRIVDELCRVVQPESRILFSFFAPSQAMREVYAQLGLMTRSTQHNDRIVRLWLAASDPRAAAALIAQWTGSGGAQSQLRWDRFGAWLSGWFTALSAARQQLRDAGEPHAERRLSQGLAWDLPGWSEPELPIWLRRPLLQVTEDWTCDQTCVRFVVARRGG